MVGPEDHDGVVGVAVSFKGIEEAADLGIDEAGAGEVAAGQVHPFVVLFEPTEARLGKGPVHVPGEAGSVGAVFALDEREGGFGFRVEIIPLLGGEAGDVGEEKSGGEEEGAFGFGIERFDGPIGDLVVTFVFVLVRKEAPVNELHFTGGVDEFLLWEGGAGGTRAEVVELLVLGLAAISSVVDFSAGVGGVTVAFQVLGECGEVFELIELAEPGAESVNAGRVRAQAHHEAGAGGITERGLAVGVGKKSSA